MHEHRLGVVPGVVSGGQESIPLPAGNFIEKCVAHLPGRLLHPPPLSGGLAGHVSVTHKEGDAAAVAPGADKVLLPVGCRPDAVVVVGGPHLVAAPLRPLHEAAEQIHGVGPPVQCAQHLVPRGNEMIGKAHQ